MKFVIKTAVLAAMVVGLFGFIGTDDPAKALTDLQKFSQETMTAARAGGQQAVNEARDKITAKAKEAVAGVESAKVEPKDGLNWAQLFNMARQSADARTAAERFLTSTPGAEEKFRAQTIIVTTYVADKNGEGIHATLERMETSTPAQTFQFASMAGGYSELISKSKGVDAAVALMDKAEAKLDLKATEERERNTAEMLTYNLANSRMDLLVAAGQKDRALKALDAGIARLGEARAANQLKVLKNQITVVGSNAPALTFEKGYGSFPGLDKLKGKVVLLDFFAHWCGPCKAAFPEMVQLYKDLNPKGLEILGVTRYYGYYGQEKGLSKDAEYAKMADFIKEFNLPWSVQFGENTNFAAYGVTSIPHIAVIDKQGKVRKLRIGYYPNGFAEFRAELEKMLAE